MSLALVAPAAAQTITDLIRGSGSSTVACDPGSQNCTTGASVGIGPGSCSPTVSGATCDAQTPAVQTPAIPINSGAGNPINIITGNKYQRDVDMPALPGVLGLELVRHYNSTLSLSNQKNGIVGRGWRLSYETDLYDRGDSLHILQADGSRLIFRRHSNDLTSYTGEDPGRGRITVRATADGPDYTWTWTNGRQLNFNAQGRLVQILAPTGEFVSLQRAPNGNLLKVTDPRDAACS